MKNIIKCAVMLAIMMCFFSISYSFAASDTYEIPRVRDFDAYETANEIESIVNGKSIIEGAVTDNKIYIDGAAVSEKSEEAKNESDNYIERLGQKGMQLNRELNLVVTVHIDNADLSDFTDIIIDNSNITKLSDVPSLKIAFGGVREYIVLDNEAIDYILKNYKEFRIQLKKLYGTYTLRFLDINNNIISKYGTDIKLAMPAEHSEQTVYLFMNNKQENWGGQYNIDVRSIEIMTKYTGEYNVASPEITITDIENLSEYEQQAIRFMVARGYFELANNKFNPGATLTRYSFAESLVRMFFALDNDAVCTFSDVNAENYKYVAASEQSDIVAGFNDGTFRGNQNVTVEQVIALTARTINQKNGYVYPEQIERYLNFTDDNKISDWAKKEIALALREGIYTNEMQLKLSDGITRKDAAVILYRLFMIMNNTPRQSDMVGYDMNGVSSHKTVWTAGNAVVAVSAMFLINIVAMILALVLIKKKGREIGSDSK